MTLHDFLEPFPSIQLLTTHTYARKQVIGTIVQQNQFKKDPESIENLVKSFNYAFWTAASFGYFAFVAAIPGLWGIGILNKTGESARVEKLVAHHHEKEVIGVKEKEADPEAVTAVVSARSWKNGYTNTWASNYGNGVKSFRLSGWGGCDDLMWYSCQLVLDTSLSERFSSRIMSLH